VFSFGGMGNGRRGAERLAMALLEYPVAGSQGSFVKYVFVYFENFDGLETF
jgi:hypothetical protein